MSGKSAGGGVVAGLLFVVAVIIIGALLGYKGNEVPGPDVTVYETPDHTVVIVPQHTAKVRR